MQPSSDLNPCGCSPYLVHPLVLIGSGMGADHNGCSPYD